MNKKQIAKLQQLGDESQYQQQADYFLTTCGVHFEAVKAVPQDAPQWAKDGKHGTKYSITLAKIDSTKGVVNEFTRVEQQPQLFSEVITFPFWNSIHAKEQAKKSPIKSDKPSKYDVIATLDVMYNDTFEDWCFNYGYDEDSREAYKTYKAYLELDAKLRKVFTDGQLEALQYIN